MIKIIPFSDELSTKFYEINHQWISNMFTMEEVDEKVLRNPHKLILNPGGFIWFAKHSELGVIGTCALRKTGPRQYELTKMGVLEKARGHKAGEILLKYVINYVRENDLGLCYLLTNSKCVAAIKLYERHGFDHDPEIKEKFGCEYQRCDIAMRLLHNNSK